MSLLGKLVVSVVLLECGILTVMGHGMLLNPVSRGSRWRYDAKATANYDDNQLFCGGFNVQWNVNGGKCGLCGDDYRLSKPRPHENGGTYGNGVIVGSYTAGKSLPVSVYITANHWGYFLFDLCNLSNRGNENDECFAANKLKLINGSDRYVVPNSSTGWFNTTLQLPKELSCIHCVLRWTYNVGNSWGSCADGTGAVGCGAQENFRGCSDISIVRFSTAKGSYFRNVTNEKSYNTKAELGETKLLEKLRNVKPNAI